MKIVALIGNRFYVTHINIRHFILITYNKIGIFLLHVIFAMQIYYIDLELWFIKNKQYC